MASNADVLVLLAMLAEQSGETVSPQRIDFTGQRLHSARDVAEQQAKGWHQHIIHQAGNDGAKGCTNDNTHGHVYGVAAYRKFEKIFNHLLFLTTGKINQQRIIQRKDHGCPAD